MKGLSVKGFTLMESMMVMLILGTSAAIFTTVLSEGNNAYIFMSRLNRITQESRGAMNWMIQELRSELRVGASNGFTTAASGNLQFTRRSDSGVVTYSWSGGDTLARQFDATTNTLAKNVTALTFTYLDASENVLTAPVANPENIVTIRITMMIQMGDETITVTSDVSPRNS